VSVRLYPAKCSELRTPLHQILAITQVLRSAMIDLAEAPSSCESYSSSLQQIRDLVPILDAIDTSGKTLHGIVDNILSFLDLKTKDAGTPSTPRTVSERGGEHKLLVDMLEEVILQAHEDNERSRRSALQSPNSIETIFAIEPASLGTNYVEDGDGALRRYVSSGAEKNGLS
jgi:signal transduction histidine kinase